MPATEWIIFIPAILCLVALLFGGLRVAFLGVYLPALLLLPMYFYARLPHLPPLTFIDTAALPLIAVLMAQGLRGWRLRWMDALVLAYTWSAGYSEWTNSSIFNGGLQFYAKLSAVVFPYMMGRLLIDPPDTAPADTAPSGQSQPIPPHHRKQFVQCLIGLLTFVAFTNLYDFFSGFSSSQALWKKFFPDQPIEWPQQMRWGFGRIEGPFAQAILAGMIFLCGIAYCLWLLRADTRWGARRLVAGVPLTLRNITLAALLAGLLMTQSRGPWLGAIVMGGVLWLAQAHSLRRAVAQFLLVAAIAATVAFVYGSEYTAGSRLHAQNAEQEDAIYRRELIKNYLPIFEQRPVFGWGITTYPTIDGQKSIDNQYLFLAVTQGLVGLGIFTAICLASCARLMRLLRAPVTQHDRFLLFVHLGVLIGLMTTIATVYLGQQTELMLFLIVGWVQALDERKLARAAGLSIDQVPVIHRFQSVLG